MEPSVACSISHCAPQETGQLRPHRVHVPDGIMCPATCIPLGKLHGPRAPQEKGNDEPFPSTLLLWTIKLLPSYGEAETFNECSPTPPCEFSQVSRDWSPSLLNPNPTPYPLHCNCCQSIYLGNPGRVTTSLDQLGNILLIIAKV